MSILPYSYFDRIPFLEPSQLANNVARCEVRAPEVLEQQYIREGRDLDRAADALLLADAGSKARPAAAPGGPARAIGDFLMIRLFRSLHRHLCKFKIRRKKFEKFKIREIRGRQPFEPFQSSQLS